MSENIKHECGIALIRLLKPLDYYVKKYGTALYGLDRMYLLMEKQHNRGQDGAGLASVKLDMPAGRPYIDMARSVAASPIKDVFAQTVAEIDANLSLKPELKKDEEAFWYKENVAFASEIFLGHLRYGTFGKNDIRNIHPFIRESNWKTRNLILAGNFNLTNIDELFSILVDSGQHPVQTGDTRTVLELLAKVLDRENHRLYLQYKAANINKVEISELLPKALDIEKIVREVATNWDGGFVFSGLLGHGDAFVLRDANGIRPAYYYLDDEVLVVASERPVIQTTFNVPFEDVKELEAGHLLLCKKSGEVSINPCLPKSKEGKKACSFEHIYFSRGTDAQIYQERKMLGRLMVPEILKAINYDIENTVFSSIPNTAQVAFNGMHEGLRDYCQEIQRDKILALNAIPTKEDLEKILKLHPRVDQIAVKDAKLRTFITQDDVRDDLVSHVYDVTYGLVKEHKDTLVVVDDSIVRGTTLKQSIIRILDRLGPKKIIVVSSAPQIRYPDCYGIDMAILGDFIAFQATIALLKERGLYSIIEDVYAKCKAQESLPKAEVKNYVKEIYAPFSTEEISKKIAELITSDSINAEVEVIYQSVENLHKSCPKNKGDWYFTGDYPTLGGNVVLNKALINYMEDRNIRAY